MISWQNSASRTPKQNQSSGLLTAEQAAQVIGVSKRHLLTLSLRGHLIPVGKAGKNGLSFLFSQSDVEALKEERRQRWEEMRERKAKWRVRT